MALVTSPAWPGARTLTAGLYYRSGAYHGSWDVAMPLWTPLYAAADGRIADLYTTARNNPAGYNPGSGAPSNWRMLHTTMNGEKVTLFYNHLSPGTGGAYRGKFVRKGDLIGYSGNSGNSTGPHLHITAMRGWRYGWQRYDYLRDRSLVIYAPDLVWKATEQPAPPAPVTPTETKPEPTEATMLITEKIGRATHWLVLPGSPPILLNVSQADAETWTGPRLTITNSVAWDRLVRATVTAR